MPRSLSLSLSVVAVEGQKSRVGRRKRGERGGKRMREGGKRGRIRAFVYCTACTRRIVELKKKKSSRERRREKDKNEKNKALVDRTVDETVVGGDGTWYARNLPWYDLKCVVWCVGGLGGPWARGGDRLFRRRVVSFLGGAPGLGAACWRGLAGC